MEATQIMTSVVAIPDRHNHAPAKLPNVSVSNPEQRQPVAAVGQDIPPPDSPNSGKAVSREDLNAAVSRLSDYVQSVQRTLDFSVDEDTGRTIIKVIDAKTDQVIRQIPPEEVLYMLDQIATNSMEGRQDPQGLFVEEKV